jgi:hypothetical protein
VRRSKRDLVKVDLDKNTITPILVLDPGPDADITKGQGYGWSRRNTLIVGLVEHNTSADALEIDVKAKTQRRFTPVKLAEMWDSDAKLAEFNLFPRGGNHGDTSGTGRWYFHYRGFEPKNPGENRGPGGCWSLTSRGKSIYEPDGKHFIADRWRKFGIVTLSWTHYADSWMIGVNLGVPYKPVGPAISTYTFCQILFDPDKTPNFVYRPILEHKSATLWYESVGGDAGVGMHANYHSLCKLQARRDGRQFVFFATDGKYSWQDHLDRKMKPWDNNGMFLVDLEPQ